MLRRSLFCIFKWVLATQQLEKDDTEAEPVNGRSTLLALHHFWCHILYGPAKRYRIFGVIDSLRIHLATQSEIYQTNIAICIDQDVFGLQVAVHDTLLVKML